MRRAYWLAGVGLALSLPALVLAQVEVPDCVTVRGEARWAAMGYNHVVVVQNGCASRARCQVSTNVNPEVVRLEVPARETREVVTFLESPASEFTPRVRCELAR
ncbi:MAG: hypothetical protein KF729_15805 [Sandaracinaceae bacterium]|nr:hypothetical protein [Sandaracinaceae bacterium]